MPGARFPGALVSATPHVAGVGVVTFGTTITVEALSDARATVEANVEGNMNANGPVT